MNLNDLLTKASIDPTTVIVLRHRPAESQLNKVLPWLAAENPAVFDAYQRAHGARLERALSTASHVASFIGREPGRALFTGLYEVRGHEPLTEDQFWSIPENVELRKHGMRGFVPDDERSSIYWFDLERTGVYSQWTGRLVVRWPSPERSWWRWAHKNEFIVECIHAENVLIPRMPEWHTMNLSWTDLSALPMAWMASLREWRGIYYIFDESSCKGYVGSASGNENILGRWLGYAASGHGGNKLLRHCNPQFFRFSILQRLSPDLPTADVIQVETSWKERLHTRSPFGLNEN